MHAEDLTMTTEVGVSARAADTTPAGDDRIAYEASSHQSWVDADADAFNGAAELMSHHQGWLASRTVVLEGFELASTKATSSDTKEHFASSCLGGGKVADFELIEGRIEQGFHKTLVGGARS